jgi:hypothetical protein
MRDDEAERLQAFHPFAGHVHIAAILWRIRRRFLRRQCLPGLNLLKEIQILYELCTGWFGLFV